MADRKGILLTVGTGLLVIVPAAIGLVGNTSFAKSVPVSVPPQATLMDESSHERGIRTGQPGDDKGGQRGPGTAEPGDDKGGQRGPGTPSPADDSVGQNSIGAPSPAAVTGGQRNLSTPGSGQGAAEDGPSGKGQNGGHGGSASQSGRSNDGSGHT